jgi:hypothetical protein
VVEEAIPLCAKLGLYGLTYNEAEMGPNAD